MEILRCSVIGNFSTNDHTAVAVSVFAYGPAAEFFSTVFIKNTAIFDKIDSIFPRTKVHVEFVVES
jgi:alkaline phosphatase